MNGIKNQIQQTMESIDSINRAELSFDLQNKILARILSPNGKIISLQTKLIWRAAACVVVLIGMNIFSIVHFNKSKTVSSEISNPIATEYFSYMTNS